MAGEDGEVVDSDAPWMAADGTLPPSVPLHLTYVGCSEPLVLPLPSAAQELDERGTKDRAQLLRGLVSALVIA